MNYLYHLVIIFIFTGIGFFLSASSGALVGLVAGILSVVLSLLCKRFQWSTGESLGVVFLFALVISFLIWLCWDFYTGGWDEVIAFFLLILFGAIITIISPKEK